MGLIFVIRPSSSVPLIKSGCNEPVSPKESQQSNWSENRGKDGKKECGSPAKHCVNAIDDPARKYHHKKVLCKIICGDDPKEGGGKFLHRLLENFVQMRNQVFKKGSLIFLFLAWLQFYHSILKRFFPNCNSDRDSRSNPHR